MNLQTTLFLLCFCFCFLVRFVDAGDDLYELLGVEKHADDRTIRKAFKKLALQFHPDKNKDDEKAHEKFVKINRAYEVLKDEELRKKYDLFGDKGLEEGFSGGQNYQSWSFYQNNFGIYDEDPEVVTLNRADFDQSVLNGGDGVYWFVNFYSPQCSHCHLLAPDWRKMARELEGVIRVGAVNCQDEWHLCQEQGIHGYPALVFFPKRINYQGLREKEVLVQFVMNQLPAKVVNLNENNFDKVMDTRPAPWLIDFCEMEDDCLTDLTGRKLSIMLDKLVNVGSINCQKSSDLCDSLGRKFGPRFFMEKVAKGFGTEFSSFDAKELAFAVLEKLPDMMELDENSFKSALDLLKNSDHSIPWLIQFVSNEIQKDLEMRKLPAMLQNSLQIGRMNCTKFPNLCQNFHVLKFPTFAVFKNGGGYEFYHGRAISYDVAQFARESAESPLKVVGPDDLLPVLNSGTKGGVKEWLVDFFTPWCPPCMKLLPEFRKASKLMKHLGLNFGTVDCTIHHSLCQQINVNQYPTMIFYNLSNFILTPHSFVGLHGAPEIIEFVDDIRNPLVNVLDAKQFEQRVRRRAPGAIWVVDFFAPWCGPCQELGPHFRKLAKMVKEVQNVSIGSVDCTQNQRLCQDLGIAGYPAIRLYPADPKRRYVDYNNWFRDAGNLYQWVLMNLPQEAEDIDENFFFEKILLSEEPWLIDFYAPWCGHCQVFAPEFERAARMLKGEVRFAKMNCEQYRPACQAAGVRGYPTVKLYPGVEEEGQTQSIYGEDINSQSADWIYQYVRNSLGLPEPEKQPRKQKDEL